MTTNLWINNIMKDVDQFMGVYSRNNIKPPTSYPSYTIVNFSPLHSPGTHLASIIFINKSTCVYFDPLNLPFIPSEIQEYMYKNSNYIHIIKYPIQNPLSGFCGFYCLLVILFHINKVPLYYGIYSFPRQSIHNDDKCVRTIIKLLKIYYLERELNSVVIP